MKLFLDTNALIDLVAQREPFAADIEKLCIASFFGDVQLWIITQSYADAYYVLGRSAPKDEVKKALAATLEFFLAVGTFPADLKPALESNWNDIEDYLIAHSAHRVDAQFFITRDRVLVEKCPIAAMTAAEFLQYLEREKGLVYDEVRLLPVE